MIDHDACDYHRFEGLTPGCGDCQRALHMKGYSRGMLKLAAAILLARYRNDNPKSRATCLVPITTKTGCRQIHTCIVCGARMSFCPKWRMTVRVMRFIREHEEQHTRELLNGI
jgi:hypothetical protein